MTLQLPPPNPNIDREDYLRRRPRKWWHDSIIDDMLAAPLDTVKVRAARLGYTPAGLQMILSSDMFKSAYAARRRNYEEALDASLIHKTAKFAEKGLDILLEHLETKRTSLPFGQVADAVIGPNGALARLGYGGKQSPSTVVHVNSGQGAGATVLQVSSDDLAKAREKLRTVERSALSASARSVEGPSVTLLSETAGPEGGRDA